MTPVIRTNNLSKVYKIGERSHLTGGYQTLRETIMSAASAPFRKIRDRFRRNEAEPSAGPSEHWALKEVDLEVAEGEVLGLIGRNGAGKSTLLKVLSRITEPTQGRVELRGRVVSLLEIGTGFHQELTGRENIYLHGAILGMAKQEIDRKFDDIVAFAEIEKFLETPTKRYSSGMYTRLAFAVAAHLDAEILLVDEVLAVGDASFQKRCLERIRELAKSGSTVIFVSHSMGTVAWLCKTALVLDQGQVIGRGEANEQIRLYMNRLNERIATRLVDREDRTGNGAVQCTDITFLDGEGQPVEQAMSGKSLTIRLRYRAKAPLSNTEIYLWLCNEQGNNVTQLSSRFTGDIFEGLPQEGTIDCVIPEVSLAQGTYLVHLSMWDNLDEADNVQAAARLEVEPGTFYVTGRTPPPADAQVLTRHHWTFGEQ